MVNWVVGRNLKDSAHHRVALGRQARGGGGPAHPARSKRQGGAVGGVRVNPNRPHDFATATVFAAHRRHFAADRRQFAANNAAVRHHRRRRGAPRGALPFLRRRRTICRRHLPVAAPTRDAPALLPPYPPPPPASTIRHPPLSPSTIHCRHGHPSVCRRFASRIRPTAPDPHRNRRPAEPGRHSPAPC